MGDSMRIVFLLLALANPVVADTLEVITDEATGAIISTVRVAKPGDHGHGDPLPGKTCAWIVDADNPPGMIDADGVPQLRLVAGKIRARIKADVDADVAKVRAREALNRRIAVKARRIAVEAVAAESPDDPEVTAALKKAREDEAR